MWPRRAAGDGEVAGQAAHIDALAGGDLEDGGVLVGALDQSNELTRAGRGSRAGGRPSRAMS